LFAVTQPADAEAPAPFTISISFAVCPNAGATPKIATSAKRPNSAPNGFDIFINPSALNLLINYGHHFTIQ
jgi:hypothetical protein